ncbi:MAG: oligosaccharide flippase family protein, partial [Myxococcota bacterium]
VETLMFAGTAGGSFLLGLVRTKLQAVAWGPIGVGAIGLMQAAMGTATLVGGAGLDGLIARELALSTEGERRARLVSAGTSGVLALALLAQLLATVVFIGAGARVGVSSWMAGSVVGAGVAMGILAVNARAVLSGLGITRAVAHGQVTAALMSTAVVVGLVLAEVTEEVWALAVAIVPAAQFLALLGPVRAHAETSWRNWRVSLLSLPPLLRRAGVLAVAGVIPVLGQLLVRVVARQGMGAEEFGSFQASLALSAVAVSVLASSVGPSGLPRLSAASGDERKLLRLAVGVTVDYLVLFAPMALVLAALPELAVEALLSKQFDGAVTQLPWQLVGEVFRLPCWVFATALIAQGRYRTYLAFEVLALASNVTATYLVATSGSPMLYGLGFSASLVGQFLLVLLLIRVQFDGEAWRLLGRLAMLAAVVALCAGLARVNLMVRALGVLAALASALVAAQRVGSVIRRR